MMKETAYFTSHKTPSAFKIDGLTPCKLISQAGAEARIRTLDNIALSVPVSSLSPRRQGDQDVLSVFEQPRCMKLFAAAPQLFAPADRVFSPLNRVHFDPCFQSNYLVVLDGGACNLSTKQAACYNLLKYALVSPMMLFESGGTFKLSCFPGTLTIRKQADYQQNVIDQLVMRFAQLFQADTGAIREALTKCAAEVEESGSEGEKFSAIIALCEYFAGFSCIDDGQQEVLIIIQKQGEFAGFQRALFKQLLKSAISKSRLNTERIELSQIELRHKSAVIRAIRRFFNDQFYDVICSLSDIDVATLQQIMRCQQNYEFVSCAEICQRTSQPFDEVREFIEENIQGFWCNTDIFAAIINEEACGYGANALGVSVVDELAKLRIFSTDEHETGAMTLFGLGSSITEEKFAEIRFPGAEVTCETASMGSGTGVSVPATTCTGEPVNSTLYESISGRTINSIKLLESHIACRPMESGTHGAQTIDPVKVQFANGTTKATARASIGGELLRLERQAKQIQRSIQENGRQQKAAGGCTATDWSEKSYAAVPELERIDIHRCDLTEIPDLSERLKQRQDARVSSPSGVLWQSQLKAVAIEPLGVPEPGERFENDPQYDLLRERLFNPPMCEEVALRHEVIEPRITKVTPVVVGWLALSQASAASNTVDAAQVCAAANSAGNEEGVQYASEIKENHTISRDDGNNEESTLARAAVNTNGAAHDSGEGLKASLIHTPLIITNKLQEAQSSEAFVQLSDSDDDGALGDNYARPLSEMRGNNSFLIKRKSSSLCLLSRNSFSNSNLLPVEQERQEVERLAFAEFLLPRREAQSFLDYVQEEESQHKRELAMQESVASVTTAPEHELTREKSTYQLERESNLRRCKSMEQMSNQAFRSAITSFNQSFEQQDNKAAQQMGQMIAQQESRQQVEIEQCDLIAQALECSNVLCRQHEDLVKYALAGQQLENEDEEKGNQEASAHQDEEKPKEPAGDALPARSAVSAEGDGVLSGDAHKATAIDLADPAGNNTGLKASGSKYSLIDEIMQQRKKPDAERKQPEGQENSDRNGSVSGNSGAAAEQFSLIDEIMGKRAKEQEDNTQHALESEKLGKSGSKYSLIDEIMGQKDEKKLSIEEEFKLKMKKRQDSNINISTSVANEQETSESNVSSQLSMVQEKSSRKESISEQFEQRMKYHKEQSLSNRSNLSSSAIYGQTVEQLSGGSRPEETDFDEYIEQYKLFLSNLAEQRSQVSEMSEISQENYSRARSSMEHSQLSNVSIHNAVQHGQQKDRSRNSSFASKVGLLKQKLKNSSEKEIAETE